MTESSLAEEVSERITRGEMMGASETIVDHLVRIEAEAGEDGGREIAGRDGILVGVGPDLVAGPPGLASLNPSAREDDAVTVGPMVPSAGGIDPRRSTKFTRGDDESAVEQSPLVEVLQQGGIGLIGGGDEIVRHAGEDIRVAVPVGKLAVVNFVVHVDEAHAGLDEPTGQQQRLAERMTTVAIARLILFVADAEGFPDRFRFQHVDGPFLIGGHRLSRIGTGLFGEFCRREMREQIAASVEPVRGNLAGQRKLIDLEIGAIGIANHLERIVRRPQEAGVLAGEDDDVVHHMRQRHMQRY